MPTATINSGIDKTLDHSLDIRMIIPATRKKLRRGGDIMAVEHTLILIATVKLVAHIVFDLTISTFLPKLQLRNIIFAIRNNTTLFSIGFYCSHLLFIH